jgi:uncharacterized protein (TIGR02996 family)
MNEGESLLASIIADPDDDAIRLVYADWLDEYGGEAEAGRAEFIRVQIEKESLPEVDPKRSALEATEAGLLDLHAEDWLRHLPEWARPLKWKLIATAPDDFGFRRGFLRGVVIPPVDIFLVEAPAVFTSEPITHAFLTDANALPELGQSREFLGISWLHFCRSAATQDRGAIRFTPLPIMPRLRFLRLRRCGMGDRELKALAKWPGLATVEELELDFNYFQSAGLEALIASPYLAKLKRLDLSCLLITTKTKQALRERFGKAVHV